jgi:hypothetical protein
MNPLNILLLGVMLVEAVFLYFLLHLVKKRYPQRKINVKVIKNKESIKQRIKELKLEQWIIFSIYALLFATAGYFLIANVFPNNPLNTNGEYSIKASDMFIASNFKSLYLDKDYVLGGKVEIGDQNARLIISEEPFNFVFNPKKVIAENTSATLELSLIKSSTEVYLDDKLIIPNLDGYLKVQEFSNEKTEIWVKKNLVREKYKSSNNAEDFIYENFPGHSIYSFAELDGGTPIIQNYEQTITEIDTTFRDNLKLAVYVEGNLDIEFTKQDLNSYIGADEYAVTITNLQGIKYFEKIYEDDGEKKDTKISDDEQNFEIKLNNLPRNIYEISFVKDKNNKNADSTIKDIKINSNKVLIIGNFLPWGGFDFYIKSNSLKTIGFKYWSSNNEQKIYQTGKVSDTIDLNKDWKNKEYGQELTKKGDYNFEIKKGYLWVYSDAISLSKNNWFYFPQEADDKLIDSDIIIIDKDKLQINGNEVVYTKIIEISEDSKFKIQVLDKFQTYFKEIKLILKEQNEKNGIRLV